MKTTVELPDELYRRAKVEAALRGRKLKDLIAEGLRRVLEQPAPEAEGGEETEGSAWDLMADGCGIVHSGKGDLATDPRHLEDFGETSKGDR
ncbi:hypothetical protein MIN45_P1617 [Methylomarinovum tepidoasis]|uniref:DUF2191 domain-containing protein n=1 Tax=Methylomarinovum tepidoasis TaxID=2840183 RepID=A0AAU9CX28_9GAMM|nr:hypothetical protein [Methylomarinovum sp. IN45]BCX89245.1 hypothetical protein MIN45_P1617 [Methylomarinovum sp. IN45]